MIYVAYRITIDSLQKPNERTSGAILEYDFSFILKQEINDNFFKDSSDD